MTLKQECQKRATPDFKCAHQSAAPYEKTPDWRKDESDDKQSRQNGFRCQNGLPCLESLLLEGGVWCTESVRCATAECAVMDVLAGFLQLPFSFLGVCSPLLFSSVRPRFRLKSAITVQDVE